MSMSRVYTEVELLKLYLAKTKALGRLPTATEVNNDPDMPGYITFIRRLGGQKIIAKKIGYKLDVRKLTSQLCLDCIYDPRSCKRDYDQCKKDADLYFRMLDSQTRKQLESH